MTPDRVPPRDHAIDAVRAVAMIGVVGGHWLVTGLRMDGDGAWRQASPLAAMPDLAPVSWLLQTLGLFFLAGGFAAARSMPPRGDGRFRVAGRRVRFRSRLGRTPRGIRRLVWPVAGLLGFWAAVLGVAAAIGTPTPTLRTIAVLGVSPLWFLLPYLALRVVTTPLAKVVDRTGPWAIALPAIAVVAASDSGLAPDWLAVPAAWSVPWVLGIALAQDRLRRGLALLLTGAGAMAVLIGVCGYPVSAVGVPGDARSNLSPPSLVAVALALAQIGVFLLVRNRLSGPPRPFAVSLNRAALPIYLSHQSVLIAVAATTSAILGRPAPGLLTAPADPWWIIQRVAWLPFLALVLAAVIKPGWRTTRRARLP
jgi:Acyltransferase family